MYHEKKKKKRTRSNSVWNFKKFQQKHSAKEKKFYRKHVFFGSTFLGMTKRLKSHSVRPVTSQTKEIAT